jgi:preprotein translocase subunit SecD
MKNILLLMGIALLSLVAAAHVTAAPPMLQFRLVVDNPTADSEPMTEVQPDNSPTKPDVLNVQKAVLLDSSDLKNAKAGVDSLQQPIIEIKFTDDGAKRFADVTGKNVGGRLAIVIDGRLYSAPRINAAITGGEAQITGHFSKEQAENLAARINGAPVQVHKSLNWSRIGFYCFAVLFVAATGIVVWTAIRRKDAPPAV